MTDVQEAFYRLAPHLVGFEPDDAGRRTVAGRRLVFFQTRLFPQLFADMRDVTGPVIDAEVQAFGEAAGHDIASGLADAFQDTGLLDTVRLLVASGFDWAALQALKPTDTRTQIEKLFGLGTFSGWVGDITIKEYNAAAGRLKVEAENTFESYPAEAGADAAGCRFLQGVLKGMLAYHWDADDLSVEETACRCSGADACTMVVSRDV